LNDDLNTSRHKNITAQGYSCGRFFIAAMLLTIFACEGRKELLQREIYDGPIMEMDSVFTMISDSGKLILKLSAPKQKDFENRDRSYPLGLYLQYFKDTRPVCTFRSNSAYFDSEQNLWKGEGNVVVKNLENGDELNTEELFWNPKEETFFTDKFVTIQSDGEIHTGEGLTASQDFSYYQILKPSGTLNVLDNQ